MAWTPNTNHPAFVCAGYDGHIKFYDLRSLQMNNSRPLSQIDQAYPTHTRITQLKYNPFIPHWLASSAEDGLIQIWDIRQLNKSIMKVNQMSPVSWKSGRGGVNDIVWSNTHVDTLMCGGQDRLWRAWKMNINENSIKEPSSIISDDTNIVHSRPQETKTLSVNMKEIAQSTIPHTSQIICIEHHLIKLASIIHSAQLGTYQDIS